MEYDEQEYFALCRGKRVAGISSKLGVKNTVFSALENVKKQIKAKLNLPHFDGKEEMEACFRELGAPIASIRMPDYIEIFLKSLKPIKSGKDDYALVLTLNHNQRLGWGLLAILKNPAEHIWKEIGLSPDRLTIKKYVSIMCKHTGKMINDSKVSLNYSHFVESSSHLADTETKNLPKMFQFYMKHPGHSKELTLKSNLNAKSFEWMSENKNAFVSD
ncbi:nmrA-like family domain-containing protein 1 [Hemitrygon akajei]|uniref:nmrA-like family domain-containing protein 1 n=1 Tax=Hemitrygon akajei TaxID=2704970 RepID=UPI003BFA2EBB